MRSVPLTAAPAIRSDALVLANEPESGPNLHLTLRISGWPAARPGQFVMLSPGAVCSVRRDDPLLPRPMAVFRQSSPAKGDPDLRDGQAEVEILYKIEGRGTALLARAIAGDVVRVVGPLGRPFELPRAGTRTVVVAGGTGVASVFGLVAAAPAEARCSVILGARSADDLMARSEFLALGVDLHFTTEDGSLGETGRVTDPLARALADGDVGEVYCCGPTAMMRTCAEMCAGAGVRCIVSLENNMACGFGVCLGCAAPRPGGDYALVCRDGPVFDAAEIDWEQLP